MVQAGRQAGGRGGEGSQGEGAAKLARGPLRAEDARAPESCAGVLARRALGVPAQPRRKCPFLAGRIAGSPEARRERGLICIVVTRPPPIAAPPSGPGNFKKPRPGEQRLCAPEHVQSRAGIGCVQPRTHGAESSVDSSQGSWPWGRL